MPSAAGADFLKGITGSVTQLVAVAAFASAMLLATALVACSAISTVTTAARVVGTATAAAIKAAGSESASLPHGQAVSVAHMLPLVHVRSLDRQLAYGRHARGSNCPHPNN